MSLTSEQFYLSRVAAPTDAEKQGWLTADAQAHGFKFVLDLVESRVPLAGLSVHDAGCGFGDIVPEVVRRGAGAYVGTDVLAEMIGAARRRQPERLFRQLDLRREDPPKVDVTLCMGALAYQNADDVESILQRLWDSTGRVFAFIAWQGLPASLDPTGEYRVAEKRVRAFLRRVAPADRRIERTTEYGVAYEAAYAVFR